LHGASRAVRAVTDSPAVVTAEIGVSTSFERIGGGAADLSSGPSWRGHCRSEVSAKRRGLPGPAGGAVFAFVELEGGRPRPPARGYGSQPGRRRKVVGVSIRVASVHAWWVRHLGVRRRGSGYSPSLVAPPPPQGSPRLAHDAETGQRPGGSRRRRRVRNERAAARAVGREAPATRRGKTCCGRAAHADHNGVRGTGQMPLGS
jgi:hypothetical protein